MLQVNAFGYRQKIYCNPGKYFSGNERETLLNDLTDIARDGFGSEITKEDVENHVMNVDILSLMNNGNHIIGFSSFDNIRFNGMNILYLHGAVVKRNFQKNGIFSRFCKTVMSLDNYDFLSMRTQNPVIYATAEKLTNTIYPNIDEAIPHEIKDIAKYIAKDYLKMDDFCENNLVGRKTYGSSLYQDIPRCENDCINEFFDDMLNLDYSLGDSVIVIGKV